MYDQWRTADLCREQFNPLSQMPRIKQTRTCVVELYLSSASAPTYRGCPTALLIPNSNFISVDHQEEVTEHRDRYKIQNEVSDCRHIRVAPHPGDRSDAALHRALSASRTPGALVRAGKQFGRFGSSLHRCLEWLVLFAHVWITLAPSRN